MQKVLFLLLAFLTSAFGLFACCMEEPHTLTELLLQDQKNRMVFLCRITQSASNLEGAYFSRANVLEVFKGDLKQSNVLIYTGGNTSAGGYQAGISREWLIFSPMDKNGEFSAAVCDPFSCDRSFDPEVFNNRLEVITSFKKMTRSAYTGPVVWYYHDGVKAAEGQFQFGKPEGKWKHYRPSGALKSEFNYKKGRLHGDCMEWMEFEAGSTLSTYKHGTLLGQKSNRVRGRNRSTSETTYLGRKNGIQRVHFKSWHPNGMLSSDFYQESIAVQGQSWYHFTGYDGVYLEQDSTGKILNKGVYYHGAKIGKWIQTSFKAEVQTEIDYPQPDLPSTGFFGLYEDGKPKITGTLNRGKPQGMWRYYSQKGFLLMEANFVKGKRSGEARAFHYLSEKVAERNQYLNDLQEGEQLRFFENGSICEQYYCRNGLKQGPSMLYLKPDVWWIKANYQDGKLDGDYISLSYEGDTSLVARFRMDALDGMAIEFSKELKTCQKSTGQYLNGFKTGEWNTFDCQGKLIKKCRFEGENASHCSYRSLWEGVCQKIE